VPKKVGGWLDFFLSDRGGWVWRLGLGGTGMVSHYEERLIGVKGIGG